MYPYKQLNNYIELINQMKEDVSFSPSFKVSPWVKDMIKGMLTVSEEDRLDIKTVVKII